MFAKETIDLSDAHIRNLTQALRVRCEGGLMSIDTHPFWRKECETLNAIANIDRFKIFCEDAPRPDLADSFREGINRAAAILIDAEISGDRSAAEWIDRLVTRFNEWREGVLADPMGSLGKRIDR